MNGATQQNAVNGGTARVPRDNKTEAGQKIRREVTRLIAAGLLASKDFFRSNLPLVSAVPHHHIGHFLFADYRRVCLIVWGTALDMRDIASSLQEEANSPIKWIASVAVFSLGLIMSMAFSSSTEAGVLAGVLIGGIAAWVTFAVTSNIINAAHKRRLNADLAAIRVRDLTALVSGFEPQSAARAETKIPKAMMGPWGKGDLDNAMCPVLVASNDTDPFPGFGWLRQSQVFTCRPKEEGRRRGSGRLDTTAKIDARLNKLASDLELPIEFGHVVVVHGHSITRGSRWLDEAGRPIRAMKKASFELHDAVRGEVEVHDPRASARLYSVVQIIMDKYMTCVTFFVRSFMLGDSVAFEVCVCTLGPPKFTWTDIKRRLDEHVRKAESTDDFVREHLFSDEDISAIKALDPTQWTGRGSFGFLETTLALIATLQTHGDEWPGKYLTVPNWREVHSEPMTNDFFGRTECVATVRVVYDRICRAILDALEEGGFDVSDYRDKNGHLINIGRVDQWVNVETNSGSINLANGNKEIAPAPRADNANVNSQTQAGAP